MWKVEYEMKWGWWGWGKRLSFDIEGGRGRGGGLHSTPKFITIFFAHKV